MAEGKKVSEEDIIKKYDLTETVFPYLDRHLVFQVADFLSTTDLYDEKQLSELKFNILKETYMVDYLNELWEQFHDDGKEWEDYHERKQSVIQEIDRLENLVDPYFQVLGNPDVIGSLKQDKIQNQSILREYGVTLDVINGLYKYGQLKFNCGEYRAAADMLDQFRIFSTDDQLIHSATWGKFACEIILFEDMSDGVLGELQKVREIVDQRSFGDPLKQLHNRTWIIHWALFLQLSKDFNKDVLIDLFFSASYISAIQAATPWVIRYLAADVICMNSKGRNSTNFQKRIKDIVRVIGQEIYEYHDPITDFVKALYIDFDFVEAQNKLKEAEVILANDFFLSGLREEFLMSARHLISELYCKIHQRIDTKKLFDLLNLNQEQGEKWIANLIRDTKMDAKINESDGTVILNHPGTSIYQQVIDATKGLSFKANQVLAQAVDKQNHQV